MNLEDYVITICFDICERPYVKVTKKGEPHKCNVEELKVISRTLNLIRERINSVVEDPELIK